MMLLASQRKRALLSEASAVNVYSFLERRPVVLWDEGGELGVPMLNEFLIGFEWEMGCCSCSVQTKGCKKFVPLGVFYQSSVVLPVRHPHLDAVFVPN